MKPTMLWAALAVTLLGAAPGHGQKAEATPTPARRVTLKPVRPGNYAFWSVGRSGQSEIAALTAAQPEAAITLAADDGQIVVQDEASGLLAIYPVAALKSNFQTVSADDFKWIRQVDVRVLGEGGKLVEKASVTLTSEGDRPRRRVITAVDRGITRFENVPIGAATLRASAGAGGPETTQTIVLAATTESGPKTIDILLNGAVATLTPTPAPLATLPPANAPGGVTIIERGGETPRNDLVSGWIGLALAAVGIFFAWRHWRGRGLTLPGALEKLGVTLPENAPGGPSPHLKPAPAPAPPLPSLAELPPAGAAPSATPLALGPRLVAISGPVAGQVFPLTAEARAAFTFGRDSGSILALPQDSAVSRHHGRIERQERGWTVIDEGSSNGTFVNGQRVDKPEPLSPGDEIWIGTTRLRFEA